MSDCRRVILTKVLLKYMTVLQIAQHQNQKIESVGLWKKWELFPVSNVQPQKLLVIKKGNE